MAEREAAADRRDAVALDERHERALVAAHDLERVVGAALVLPHQHRRDRLAAARRSARSTSTGCTPTSPRPRPRRRDARPSPRARASTSWSHIASASCVAVSGPRSIGTRALRAAEHGRRRRGRARPSGWWSRRRLRAHTAWGAFSRADSGRGNVGRRHAARHDRSRSVPRRDHRPLVGAYPERRLSRQLRHAGVDARVAGCRSGRVERPLRRARRDPGRRRSRSRCCARGGPHATLQARTLPGRAGCGCARDVRPAPRRRARARQHDHAGDPAARGVWGATSRPGFGAR